MKREILNTAKSVLPYSVRINLRKINWKRLYYQRVASRLLRGKLPSQKVYCPVSDREYYFYIVVRNDKVSPVGGAKSRHRLMWLYLQNETSLFKKENSLLHVAPEYCLFHRFKKISNITYYPGDKFEKGYGVQSGVNQLDLTNLDLKDNSFNYIICSHILEHIPDDNKAMAEMFRVLKPGGQVFVMVPIDESLDKTYEDFSITDPVEREKQFGQWDHVRFYGTDISDRLRQQGFTVDAVLYADHFSLADIEKFGLNRDYIFVATKASS